MEFFKYTRTFNFMGKSKIAMIFSIILVLASYALLELKVLTTVLISPVVQSFK